MQTLNSALHRPTSSGKWRRHGHWAFRRKSVLIGPLTYLYLGKESTPGFSRLDLLPRLLPVYREILGQLASLGVEWVQIDEPLLALDLEDEWLRGLDQAYAFLTESKLTKLLLTTYFEAVHNHATRLKALPVRWPAYRFVPCARPARNFSRQLPCRESALARHH